MRKSPPRRPPVRRVGQDWRWWLVIVVVVVAVIAGVLVQQSRSETEHARVVTPRAAVGPNGGVLTGNPRARVSITEYADFQCPICRQLHQRWSTTLTKLVDQGRARFEFIGLAFLDGGTTESTDSAAAAICAADAGKFTQYHDTLYDKQSPDERSGYLTASRLLAFGRSVGLTSRSFERCVRTGRYKGFVRKATDTASQRGVTGTPTVFVNGKEVSNAKVADPETLTALVDRDTGNSS